jgi:hypothetical protein
LSMRIVPELISCNSEYVAFLISVFSVENMLPVMYKWKRSYSETINRRVSVRIHRVKARAGIREDSVSHMLEKINGGGVLLEV